MPVSPAKILLTGHPGSGKTTTVREVVKRLLGRVPMCGFFTEELREAGRRVGFRGVTLDGRSFPLAHVGTKGTMRIGPYGVDLTGLETIGIDALTPKEGGTLVVLDEIGKMECLSETFKTRVQRLLDDDTPLVATVAAVGVGFVKKVRNSDRAKMFTMTRGESDGMSGEIAREVLASMRQRNGGAS